MTVNNFQIWLLPGPIYYGQFQLQGNLLFSMIYQTVTFHGQLKNYQLLATNYLLKEIIYRMGSYP